MSSYNYQGGSGDPFDPLNINKGQIERNKTNLSLLKGEVEAIKDETLRTLIAKTIDERLKEPRFFQASKDIKVFEIAVEFLTGEIALKQNSELDCSAANLATIFVGAAELIGQGRCNLAFATDLINGSYETDAELRGFKTTNGLDFATQYGSSKMPPRELHEFCSTPNRDLLAEHLDDREILLREIFKVGYERVALEY
jgi:hypothetical protein